MADLATLTAWLAEAETARHQLSIGKQVVRVPTETGHLEYTPASLAQLESYIARLQAAISASSGRPVRRHFTPGFDL